MICINVAHVEAVSGLDERDGTAIYLTSGEKHVLPNASVSEVAVQLRQAQIYIDGTHRMLKKQEEMREEIEQFVADRCIVGEQDGDNTALYLAYTEWCRDGLLGERSQKWFTRALLACGFRQAASRTHGRRWQGLAL
jgi:phage/plasmid-associated DNA primase